MKPNARIAALRTRAKVSQFISHIDQLPPNSKLMSFARVSDKSQKEHLPAQLSKVDWEVERRGSEVIAHFDAVASSEDFCIQFEQAVQEAKRMGADGIVTDTFDRYLRVFAYKQKGQPRFLHPSIFDLERLMIMADGVRLYTVVHPDASPKEVRGHQTKRGKDYRKRHSRTGPKKVTRLVKLAEAERLKKLGFNYRQIGEKIGVPYRTVWGWLQKLAQNYRRSVNPQKP